MEVDGVNSEANGSTAETRLVADAQDTGLGGTAPVEAALDSPTADLDGQDLTINKDTYPSQSITASSDSGRTTIDDGSIHSPDQNGTAPLDPKSRDLYAQPGVESSDNQSHSVDASLEISGSGNGQFSHGDGDDKDNNDILASGSSDARPDNVKECVSPSNDTTIDSKNDKLPSSLKVDSPNSEEEDGDFTHLTISEENDSSRENEDSSIPTSTQIQMETGEERSESQTSVVNEYALNNTNSPTLEVDRNLEHFSEILLDTDHSQSDSEIQDNGDTTEIVSQKKRNTKRVRFADEVTEGTQQGLGLQHGPGSPPPPPSNIPSLPSPDSSSRQPGIPVNLLSPTSSPRQKLPQRRYTVEELINGVEMLAEYLGSTPIILDGHGSTRTARMFQAQQAVQLIKDPESDSHPHFPVKLKISTGAVRVADSFSDVDMMDHPLHTITYVADIDHVLVIMAHVRPQPPPQPPPQSPTSDTDDTIAKYIPKLTCHVFDASDAREIAMVIGQAFSAAYKQFLRSSGVSDEQLEQAEYAHVLNAQSVPRLEVESFSDRNKIKKLTLAKHKNDIMGMMVMESGYGSAIPAAVIVHLSKTGAAFKSGLLNVGDHILSMNGTNFVGMPRKACIEQIKKCRYMNVVKMEICSCPAVVDISIVRPDLKYQLGFSIHEGMICSLVRGSIAERSGVRIGHRIIDINGTSTVGMRHADVVHLLTSTVGDLHIRMMADVMYKLLTGKLQPEYC